MALELGQVKGSFGVVTMVELILLMETLPVNAGGTQHGVKTELRRLHHAKDNQKRGLRRTDVKNTWEIRWEDSLGHHNSDIQCTLWLRNRLGCEAPDNRHLMHRQKHKSTPEKLDSLLWPPASKEAMMSCLRLPQAVGGTAKLCQRPRRGTTRNPKLPSLR